MSTRIERDIAFDTAIHFDGQFFINQFYITLSLLVETESVIEQNVALQRIIHFAHSTLQDSVLINQIDIDAIKKYKDAGIRVCILPDEPFDQIISMTLLQKFNAIAEGRLRLTDLTLGSSLSEGVRFCTVQETSEDTIDSTPGLWWNCATTCIEHDPVKQEKIVKLFSDDEWEKLHLTFETKKGKKVTTK